MGKDATKGDGRFSRARDIPQQIASAEERLAQAEEELRAAQAGIEALRDSEARFRSVLHHSRDVVYRFDLRTERFDYISPACQTLLGFTPEELMGMDHDLILSMIHPDHRRAAFAAFEQAKLTGSADVEYRQATRNGDTVWLSNRISVIRDGSGEPLYRVGVLRDITEQRRMEEALRASEQRFRLLVGNAPAGIYEIDFRTRRFLSVNEAMCGMTGYTRQELLSLDAFSLLDGPSQARFQKRIEQFLSGSEPDPNVEYTVRTKDGRLVHAVLSVTFTCDPEGRPIGATVVGHDVTERRAAEEAARESISRQAFLVRLGDALRRESDPVEVRKVSCRMLCEHLETAGRSREHAASAPLDENETAAGTCCAGGTEFYRKLPRVRQRLSSGESVVVTDTARLGPREREVLEQRGFRSLICIPRLDEGSLTDVFSVGRYSVREWTAQEFSLVRETAERTWEAMARARAEAALRQSENLLRAVTDNSPDAVYVKDLEGRILFANPAVLLLVRREEKEVVGHTDLDIYTNQEAARAIMENDRRVVEAGTALTFWESARTSAGERLYMSIKAPRRDAQGQIIGVVGISRDYTEQKEAEEALRLSEERFRTVIEHSRDGINLLDLETGRYILMSPIQVEMTGFTADELLGMSAEEAYERVHPDDRELSMAQQRRVASGEDLKEPVEYRWKVKSGEYRWFSDSRQVVRDGQGKAVALVGISRDITERKKAEEELRRLNVELERRIRERTAQLEATVQELEAFSHSISHDLRAPLRAINSFASLILEDGESVLTEQSRHDLRVVIDNAQMMGRLVDELLAFSRLSRQELYSSTVPMDRLVESIIDELRPSLPVHRRVRFDIGELPPVEGSEILLRQVWINLIANALKFTRGKAETRITIGSRRDDHGITFFVEDNGIGFRNEYAGKLFGVFQRLHLEEEYEGTGIGLALVKRIVERHGGTVGAEGREGEGARFFFTLP